MATHLTDFYALNEGRPMNDIFHDRFQCFVQRLEYDFATRTGVLVMDDDNCTDMRGCIRVFEAIDPDVKIIRTMEASGHRDTSYLKLATGWEARMPAI